MNGFERGTTIAAIVLSVLFGIGIPLGMSAEYGWGGALLVVGLGLVAIWGSRLGVNALYRHIFAEGQADERGKDTDFV